MTAKDALKKVYGFTEFAGDMAIAVSPLMVLIGFIMLTVSILLKSIIATTGAFEIPWAIVQAIAVDGLWLGIWIRLRDARIAGWISGLKYMGLALVAVVMFIIGAGMSTLVTYQEVNGIADVDKAMAMLHVDATLFIIARGVLVMLCAAIAIFFQPRREAMVIPAKKSMPAPKKSTAIAAPKSTPGIPSTTVTPIPQAMPGIRLLPPVASSKGYEAAIREYMATHTAYTYKEVSEATGAAMATVKKWVPAIKKEQAS